MSVDPSSGRLRDTVTGTEFGPDFGGEGRACEFLAFIGYYPPDWRGRASFSPVAAADPRRWNAEELAAEVRRFEVEAARSPLPGWEETLEAEARRALEAATYPSSVDGRKRRLGQHHVDALLPAVIAYVSPLFDRLLADVAEAEHERDEAAIRLRAADRLADEVAALVVAGKLGSRSPAADALLDYREPPRSERSDALAEARAELEAARAREGALREGMQELRAGIATTAGYSLEAERNTTGESAAAHRLTHNLLEPLVQEIAALLAAPAPPPGGLLALVEWAERSAGGDGDSRKVSKGADLYRDFARRLRECIGLPVTEVSR